VTTCRGRPALPPDKRAATACAVAAIHGIEATPSRDDHGRHTLILRRGVWVREVLIEHLADALAEARQLRAVELTG
jgi:hypothetical protein